MGWYNGAVCLLVMFIINSGDSYDHKFWGDRRYDYRELVDKTEPYSGEDTYSMAERNKETRLDYRLAKSDFDLYSHKLDKSDSKTETKVDDCSYTFVVKHPKIPECMKSEDIKEEKTKRHENMIKLEARMIARDAYTRKEMKNMRTRILVEQSGMQYMKHNMRVQSDEQETLSEKYKGLQKDMGVLHDTMLDLRKQLRSMERRGSRSLGRRGESLVRDGVGVTRRMENKTGDGGEESRRAKGVDGITGDKKERGEEKTVSVLKEMNVGAPAQLNEISLTNKQCTSPHRSFNGHCYKYVRERRNRQAAQTNCEQLGGNLVTVESLDEQHFVQALLKQIGAKRDGYWVYAGGNDPSKDNKWAWMAQNRPITEPTFWFTNVTPSPEKGNTCMFLFLLDPAKYAYWTRDKCHYLMPSLCEVPM